MPGVGLLFLQLAGAAGATALPPPDIEVSARVTAREVRVRQEGAARISLRADPGVAPPVRVERSAPPGAKRYRNLTIDLKAEARLANREPNSTQQGSTDEADQP